LPAHQAQNSTPIFLAILCAKRIHALTALIECPFGKDTLTDHASALGAGREKIHQPTIEFLAYRRRAIMDAAAFRSEIDTVTVCFVLERMNYVPCYWMPADFGLIVCDHVAFFRMQNNEIQLTATAARTTGHITAFDHRHCSFSYHDMNSAAVALFNIEIYDD